jgi:DNA-binding response OmpR family regulator
MPLTNTESKPTLLIIDDDEKLNALLTDFLGGFGFRTVTATDAQAGLKRLERLRPALVVLDVMLPGMNGFEVCKAIRRTSNVPIIMLTARGDVTDRIVGLELGADDYLPKPFEPRELVARIQSVLRRGRPDEGNEILRFGSLSIDRTARSATLAETPLNLTTNEFDALVLLVGKPGKVFSRDEILNALRGIDCEAYNRSVDITMSRLRQKLRDNPKSPRFIKTVWGTGYVFIGQAD